MDKSILLANELQVEDIVNVVQCTIKEIYAKYYRDEVVSFFCEWHSIDRVSEDVVAKKYMLYLITTGLWQQVLLTESI